MMNWLQAESEGKYDPMNADARNESNPREEDAMLLRMFRSYSRDKILSEESPLLQLLLRELRITYWNRITNEEDLRRTVLS